MDFAEGPGPGSGYLQVTVCFGRFPSTAHGISEAKTANRSFRKNSRPQIVGLSSKPTRRTPNFWKQPYTPCIMKGVALCKDPKQFLLKSLKEDPGLRQLALHDLKPGCQAHGVVHEHDADHEPGRPRAPGPGPSQEIFLNTFMLSLQSLGKGTYPDS